MIFIDTMSTEIINYVFYKDYPDVRDFISELRAASSKNNQIVKNQISLYNFPPDVEFNFTDNGAEVVYKKGNLSSSGEECTDLSFLIEYDDFKNSELFGRTIRQVLRSGVLNLNFPKIPIQELDYNYDFGEDSVKISVCHLLPF